MGGVDAGIEDGDADAFAGVLPAADAIPGLGDVLRAVSDRGSRAIFGDGINALGVGEGGDGEEVAVVDVDDEGVKGRGGGIEDAGVAELEVAAGLCVASGALGFGGIRELDDVQSGVSVSRGGEEE